MIFWSIYPNLHSSRSIFPIFHLVPVNDYIQCPVYFRRTESMQQENINCHSTAKCRDQYKPVSKQESAHKEF